MAENPVLTLNELEALARCADPLRTSGPASAQQLARIATFERVAAPFRTLVASARRLIAAGQRIGPELEKELRHAAHGLARARKRAGTRWTEP